MMQTIQDSEWTDRMFGVFDIFVSLVLIPSSYLLNSEAVKLLIVAKGWTTFFISRLHLSPHDSIASIEVLGIHVH